MKRKPVTLLSVEDPLAFIFGITVCLSGISLFIEYITLSPLWWRVDYFVIWLSLFFFVSGLLLLVLSIMAILRKFVACKVLSCVLPIVASLGISAGLFLAVSDSVSLSSLIDELPELYLFTVYVVFLFIYSFQTFNAIKKAQQKSASLPDTHSGN